MIKPPKIELETMDGKKEASSDSQDLEYTHLKVSSTAVPSSSETDARNGMKDQTQTDDSLVMLNPNHSDNNQTKPKLMFSNLKLSNPFKSSKAKHRPSEKKRYDQKEVRATIRMAIIIACFCGCWLGFFVIYVVKSWCPKCPIPRIIDSFFFWLGYANSSMNPVLYTIFNDDFRKAFQKLLGCYKKASHTGRIRH